MERKQSWEYHLLVKNLALCDHEVFFFFAIQDEPN